VTAASSIGSLRRYVPLGHYLAALPADEASVQLSFAEIETVIGGPLPQSAKQMTYYWSTILAGNWRSLGFAAKLNRGNRSVTFTRRTVR
jgi:hypothetical protein